MSKINDGKTGRFVKEVTYKTKPIFADVIVLDEGVHISVYGGDKSHIGAIAVLSLDGEISLIEFPEHKEGIICENWAKKLKQIGIMPAVIEAGIHYDDLSKEEIREVLLVTDQLLLQIFEEII